MRMSATREAVTLQAPWPACRSRVLARICLRRNAQLVSVALAMWLPWRGHLSRARLPDLHRVGPVGDPRQIMGTRRGDKRRG